MIKCVEDDPYFFDNGGHVKYNFNTNHNIVYMTNGVDRGVDIIMCHQTALLANVADEETLLKPITNPDGTFDTLNCGPSFSLAQARSGIVWSVQMGWGHEINNAIPLAQQPSYTGKKKPAQGLCGDIRTVELDRETLEAERDAETQQFTEEDNGSGDDGT